MNLKPYIWCIWIVAFFIQCSSHNKDTSYVDETSFSPQVHADRSVSFRCLAPGADEVKLEASFINKPVSMKKEQRGTWSIKLGPLAPNIYSYCFYVDGVQTIDQFNPDSIPGKRFKYSLVEIVGDHPAAYSARNIPHGKLSHEYYNSVNQRRDGNLVIYTPPGYEDNPEQKYPVLYLISRKTDTEEAYVKAGRINFILDNLIDQGNAKPMIVVMLDQSSSELSRPNLMQEIAKDITGEELINGILPFVEQKYRVYADRQSRAIGGFSDGGSEALRQGLRHIDTFSWICTYGAFLKREEFVNEFKSIYSNPQASNQSINLLWIGTGNDDLLFNETVDFIHILKGYGINCTSLITSGGHTWENARIYLEESTKLLFVNKDSAQCE